MSYDRELWILNPKFKPDDEEDNEPEEIKVLVTYEINREDNTYVPYGDTIALAYRAYNKVTVTKVEDMSGNEITNEVSRGVLEERLEDIEN